MDKTCAEDAAARFEWCEGCEVEEGFYTIWKNVEAEVPRGGGGRLRVSAVRLLALESLESHGG